MPPIMNVKKCKACGVCADICPSGVFDMKKGTPPAIRYPDECWHCNACVLDCPASALTLRIPLPLMMVHVDVKAKSKGA